MSLADSIRGWMAESLGDLGGPVVDRLLFGMDDAGEVAAQVDAWCSDPPRCPGRRSTGLDHPSVGCVALVTLADGSGRGHQGAPARPEHGLPGRCAGGAAGRDRGAGVAAPAPVVAPAPIRDGGPLATAMLALARTPA